MTKIPTHKISETFHGEVAFMKYISENGHLPETSVIDYAHRDDYYIFLFIEKGRCKALIDFIEYEITGSTVLCILPGQVHFPVEHTNLKGWILGIDPMLVKEEYKEIFERTSFIESNIRLNENTINDLKRSVSTIQQRLNPEKTHIKESITHDLLSYYIGVIAEVYYNGLPASANNRHAAITYQFKSLLSANYRSIKSPSRYASKLNLSPIYLNEAVKKTTGLTVTECIQNEIIIQAKRLLFYTNMSVKEIASELGYEDWAYFTRLFTKIALLSPTQFRKKYFK